MMVRALEQEQEDYRSRLFHFQGMHDNAGHHVKSLSAEQSMCVEELSGDDATMPRSYGAKPQNEKPMEQQQIGWSLHKSTAKAPKSRLARDEAKDKQPTGKPC